VRPPAVRRLDFFFAVALTLALTGSVRANVRDVSGSQYGSSHFEWKVLLQTTGQDVQFRVPTPTVGTRSNSTTNFAPLLWSLDVYDESHGAVIHNFVRQNDGFSNTATFVQVRNPNPGQLFRFYIEYTGDGESNLDAFGVIHDFPASYPYIYYVSPTQYIDSNSGTISTALSTALSKWSLGPDLPWIGRRGDVEKIAMTMTDLVYRDRSINGTQTLASTVWAQQSGDCDDFVKLQVAMLRRLGVPARTNLVFDLGVPSPGAGLPTQSSTLHANGDYWNGQRWESFESNFSENFAFASEFVLGQDQDFTYLYPIPIPPGPDCPTCSALEVAGSPTLTTSWSPFSGSFRVLHTEAATEWAP
jgi:hypothetical protein